MTLRNQIKPNKDIFKTIGDVLDLTGKEIIRYKIHFYKNKNFYMENGLTPLIDKFDREVSIYLQLKRECQP